MKYFLMAILALSLPACAQFQEVQNVVRDRGARANDIALDSAQNVMCTDASVGSVRRKYGQDPDLAAAYRRLCVQSNQANILAP